MGSGNTVSVARQPIYTTDLAIFGYELLYRVNAASTHADVTDGNAASAHVLTSAFLDIGIDKLVGGGKAFVNVTGDFIAARTDIPYAAKNVVIEILETVKVTPEVCEAAADYVQRGYLVALDDFVDHPEMAPLIEYAEIIKVDIRQYSRDDLKSLAVKLKRLRKKLLAEKIETRDEYEYCKSIGFVYFQGYFLARPQVVEGRKPPQNKIALIQLLRELQNPNINIGQLERHVLADASLSYKIMKYINSPAVGLGRKVDSIKSALVLMGLAALRNWVSMIVLSGLSDQGYELVRIVLVRARMCEALANAKKDPHTETYFIVGLFSALDCMLEMPMTEILPQIGVSTAVSEALISQKGVLGEALKCAINFEQGEWDRVAYLDLTFEQIQQCFIDAIVAADGAVAHI